MVMSKTMSIDCNGSAGRLPNLVNYIKIPKFAIVYEFQNKIMNSQSNTG